MNGSFDIILVGAGSVGAPAAYFLAQKGLSVAVFEAAASPGRGENRAAIGGIRATHSDPAKIALGQESLRIFSGWQETTGDDIEWRQSGYTFVAYEESDAQMLQDLVEEQQGFGLDIGWLPAKTIEELVPGIVAEGLRGGTHSPGDGTASPLRATSSFCRQATHLGAKFFFREPVRSIALNGDKVSGVQTERGSYAAPIVINCA
ncbi:MAG: FAD-binding oxidoreductase, partial [Proteobacteria bacterium]|nr:FAD-binding oxidoreductase [Pseudomonadota bacterium]